jgi:hypothetical protein
VPHWRGIGRWLATGAGLAVAGYGIAGLVTHSRATNPANSLDWLAAGLLAHDVVVVPATTLIGLALSRLAPRSCRAVLQAALFVSGSVALASFPLWSGHGGDPGNPSVDPLPYGRNLLIVLGGIWALAGTVAVRRWWRDRGVSWPPVSRVSQVSRVSRVSRAVRARRRSGRPPR